MRLQEPGLSYRPLTIHDRAHSPALFLLLLLYTPSGLWWNLAAAGLALGCSIPTDPAALAKI